MLLDPQGYAVTLPTGVATRYHPDLKAKYRQLESSGTCNKLATTTVMRRLIVMANAGLRDGQKWNERTA